MPAEGPVPNLRFPEFRDAGPWEVRRLGEVCEINPTCANLPERFVYIDLESVEAGELIQRKMIMREDAPSRAQRVLTPGDIIYQIVRPYQRNNLLFSFPDEEHYVASTGYAQLRAHGSSEFLFQLIHTDPFVAAVLEKCTGSNYPAINSSDLGEIHVSFPSHPEQQKIADCLSSLDDLIRAEAARLGALRDHKRALMQRLFPRPGETTPRLRFPAFRDAGPWEVKRLGDEGIADFVRDRIAAVDIPAGHYVSTINLLSDFDGLAEKPEMPPPGSAIAYRAGDILMSNIRPYLRKIWVADRSGGASNDVIVARPGKKIVPTFLGHLLMSDRFISYIMDGAKGVKMPRGDLEQIQGFEVPLPSLPEQQKIADGLTALDDLIRAQGERIEALRSHKRGLMQQLFPLDIG